MSKRKKRIRITAIVVASLIIGLFVGFYIYTLDYYRADEYVAEVFLSDSTNIQSLGNMTVIYPDMNRDSKVGFIFYPGGKVEATAYIPLLDKISEEGITCILLKMPFNLAVFNVNAADKVFEEFPNIEKWFLGGHSLGGAMASSYVGKYFEKLNGLILLGAYPINEADIPTLAVYGSEDEGLNISKLEETINKLEIIGGNHAYFGNYGEQKGDGVAAITREEQQEIAAEVIVDFIISNRD